MAGGKITALRAQAKDSQRVNVFLDGQFALGISLTTLSKTGLYVGKELSAEEFAHLERVESGDKAYQVGLRLLNGRPRSAAELRDRLARKEFAPEAIETALERLSTIGLINDDAFRASGSKIVRSSARAVRAHCVMNCGARGSMRILSRTH